MVAQAWAAQGSRRSSPSARRQQAERPPHSARARRRAPAPEQAQRADQAPRSGAPATGSRSPEAQGPVHQMSGSTTARGTTKTATAPASDACFRGSTLGCAMGQGRQSASSSALRRRCGDPGAGARRGGALPREPVDLTGPPDMTLPVKPEDILEPHGAYCPMQDRPPVDNAALTGRQWRAGCRPTRHGRQDVTGTLIFTRPLACADRAVISDSASSSSPSKALHRA